MTVSTGIGVSIAQDGFGGGDFDVSYGGGGGNFGGSNDNSFVLVSYTDYQTFLDNDTTQGIPVLRYVPVRNGSASENETDNPDNVGNYDQTSTTTDNGASGVATYNQSWYDNGTEYSAGANNSAVLNNTQQELTNNFNNLSPDLKNSIETALEVDFLQATSGYNTDTKNGLAGLATAAELARNLLDTDGYGVGLTRTEINDLNATLNRANAAGTFTADTVDKVNNFLQAVNNSVGYDDGLFTGKDRAVVTNQFLDTLTPAEWAVIQNLPSLDNALGAALSDGTITGQVRSGIVTLYDGVYRPSVDGSVDPLGRAIANAVEAAQTLNGGALTDSQYNTIADKLTEAYRVYQNNTLPIPDWSPLDNNVSFNISPNTGASTSVPLDLLPTNFAENTELPAFDLSAFDTTQDQQYAGVVGDVKRLKSIVDTLTNSDLSPEQKALDLARKTTDLGTVLRVNDAVTDPGKSTLQVIEELIRINPKIDFLFKGYEFLKELVDTPAIDKVPVVDLEVVQSLQSYGEPIVLAAADSGTVSDAGTGYSFSRALSVDSAIDVPQSLIDQIRSEVANGPQTQAALDKILIEYPAAALAAAFPQFGDTAAYEKAKEQAQTTVSANGASTGNGTVVEPGSKPTVAQSQIRQTTASVSTPAQDSIAVNTTSEVARFIQWQAAQTDTYGTETIAEKWARQGITDPYSDPAIVAEAVAQINRANARIAQLDQAGLPAPGVAPWNDPNWPTYQGSNKEAYTTATAALADVNVRNKLMADNGWDLATFESWALRITDPAAWAAQAAAADAARGIVAGPSGTTTALSSNQSTVVTTAGTTAQGFTNSTVQAVASNIPVNVNAIPGASSVVSTLTGAATAAASLFAAGQAASSLIGALTAPSKVSSPYVVPAAGDLFGAVVLTPDQLLAQQQAATLLKAKSQATIQDRYNQTASGDWRVRLQLASGADYLYKSGTPGILAPLFDTDGIIFPYTPSIETSYTANYDKYDLVHSNYRGYFYKNSAVGDINLRATFTAQDTNEADYLLAVIHFFRSVTKMFYGQDDQRGAPPPMVFLTGLGNFQFNEHPCVVSSFNYSLPSDVDYIRAGAPMNYGTSLISQRAKYGSISSNPISAVITRLTSSGLNSSNPTQNIPSPGILNQSLNNLDEATYVPTKMEISIQLLPMNTRSQVSQQFSLKDFANGSLLKGGFW